MSKFPHYESRSVFIVKDKDDNHIERVFGIESAAEEFVRSTEGFYIIDEWPVEFKICQ